MKSPIIYFVAVLCVPLFAFAQAVSQPGTRNPAQGQASFNEYIASQRNSGSGGALLERASIQGVPLTAGNVQAARSVLASRVSAAEKISAIRMMGSMYTVDDKLALNSLIVRDLKDQVYAGEKQIGRAAALEFSRLTYFTNSQEVLAYARKSGLISNDEYAGELAHLLRFAPESDKVQMLPRIATTKSAYGTEVLAGGMDPKLASQLQNGSRRALVALLEHAEPKFSMAIGQYSLVDGFRYEYWLRAMALLEDASMGSTYNDVIFKHLNSEQTDPRQILAFLSAPEGKRFMTSLGKTERLTKPYERVREFAESFPNNTGIQGRVAAISAFMR